MTPHTFNTTIALGWCNVRMIISWAVLTRTTCFVRCDFPLRTHDAFFRTGIFAVLTFKTTATVYTKIQREKAHIAWCTRGGLFFNAGVGARIASRAIANSRCRWIVSQRTINTPFVILDVLTCFTKRVTTPTKLKLKSIPASHDLQPVRLESEYLPIAHW